MGFFDKAKKVVGDLGRKIAESGTIVETIKKKAAALGKKIVLCEGEDSRVVEAAGDCAKEGIAKIVLLGNADKIKLNNPDIDLTDVEIIDPVSSPKLEEYAKLLYELRKAKGMTEEQAKEQAKDATFFGALMLKAGDADGFVSGACHSTANTLRPGLQIIKTAKGVSSVSSFNLMVVLHCIRGLRAQSYIHGGGACGLRYRHRKEREGNRGARSQGRLPLLLHDGQRKARQRDARTGGGENCKGESARLEA